MIVAIFEWDDGYTETINYPKGIRGLAHNGKRPSRLKMLVENTKEHEAKISEWFSDCSAALYKGDQMTQVTFKFEGGSTAIAEYPDRVVGMQYKGKRPVSLEVVSDEHNAEIVDWINVCHFALESSG